jgi:asparagine synthase (glutamine-hydrolysing)
MCGIAVIARLPRVHVERATLAALTDVVRHRGPDGSGFSFLMSDGSEAPPGARDWTVGLGHRRLAIIDLSDSGRQPMARDGGLWVTYNGEMYNYVELRNELRSLGHVFRSTSDTEVLLAAYDEWGPDCFARMKGMWGLALLDGRRRKLVLCRDRLGIKPLYMLRGDGYVSAVSELKQFAWLPHVRLRPNPDAVSDYVLTGYEEPWRTFFAGIEPMAAGTYLEVDLRDLSATLPVSYWAPENVRPCVTDRREAAELFGAGLARSVHEHLRSDVPVACALSGGLDSSSIAVLVQARMPRGSTLHTFTASFPGDAIDELPFVEEVVRALHATAHIVTPNPEHFLMDLDAFILAHDEPVGSLSMYAGYTVARLMHEANIKVTLNGQGGDEILAGYWQSYFSYLLGLARGQRFVTLLTHVAGAAAPGGNRELLVQAPGMLRRYRERRAAAAQRITRILSMPEHERRLYEIRNLHLPRLLKWDDRNYMAFSVEGRYPFLDHNLIELALTFHPEVLYDRGWVKAPLRHYMAQLLPRLVLGRRVKIGFETPQDAWLRGTLQPMVHSLLQSDSPAWSYVSRDRVRHLTDAVLTNPRFNQSGLALFRVLMLDRWLRLFCDGSQGVAP